MEIRNAIIYLIWLGIAAGFMREGFNYYAIKIKPSKMAFFLGIGFSIIDIAVILYKILPLIRVYFFQTLSAPL